MGRNCGWLTSATADAYRKGLDALDWADPIGLSEIRKDVHAIYIPEMDVDIQAEAKRLKAVMDTHDNVNIFISEGAGVETIIKEMEAAGEEVPRDAFGHVKLDTVNPGKWFGKQFAEMLDAEKVLVQKSGYYARAAAANVEDIRLIKSCTDLAVDCAVVRESGVIGHDEDDRNILRAIEFPRIAGGKPFNIDEPWFEELLEAIGQTKGTKIAQLGH
jgi:pyrophosphate--fructose-6-phosphate 1-phosphotransferase